MISVVQGGVCVESFGCSGVCRQQECCWDVCEKYVMGFLLLPVCQPLLNLMFWDFKLVVLLSVIWVGRGLPKPACTGASLEAEMDMFAGFSQGASRDVGRITISHIPPLTGLKGGEAQLVNACVLSVYSHFCTGHICLRLHCTGLCV